MSLTGESFMGLRHHESGEGSCFGLAVAAEIKKRHPIHTAKKLATDLSAVGPDTTVKTAENILGGHLSARTITRLVRAYGLALLLDAWCTHTGQTLQDYITAQAEQARLEQAQAREKEQAYAELEEALGIRSAGGPGGLGRPAEPSSFADR